MAGERGWSSLRWTPWRWFDEMYDPILKARVSVQAFCKALSGQRNDNVWCYAQTMITPAELPEPLCGLPVPEVEHFLQHTPGDAPLVLERLRGLQAMLDTFLDPRCECTETSRCAFHVELDKAYEQELVCRG